MRKRQLAGLLEHSKYFELSEKYDPYWGEVEIERKKPAVVDEKWKKLFYPPPLRWAFLFVRRRDGLLWWYMDFISRHYVII